MLNVLDCRRTRRGHNEIQHESLRQRHVVISSDLYRQGFQVREQPTSGQPQKLVSREIELSQGRQDQKELL